MPTDSALERSLRDAVRALYGDPDASLKRIRTKAEEELGLVTGFFKSEEWKERSKEIIEDQFEKREEDQNDRAAKKRASPGTEGSRPRKKSRVDKVQEDEDEESTTLSEPPESEEEDEEEERDSESEEEEQEKPKKKSKVQQRKAGKKSTAPAKNEKKAAPRKQRSKSQPKPKKKASSESELSDAPSEPAEVSEDEARSPARKQEEGDTSSDLSSVIDDPEPVRKKASKAKNGDTKSSKRRKSSTSTTIKSKPPTGTDPNAEEIKRLQGWLVKCGIRKVWGKELKPFDTSRAKIAHLKSMLSDVGMTGRYSNEKAAQIKEARELAADIEAVKEGNERWGKGEGDEGESGSGDEDGGRPKRRLVRGAANYDFLSSDGEETD